MESARADFFERFGKFERRERIATLERPAADRPEIGRKGDVMKAFATVEEHFGHRAHFLHRPAVDPVYVFESFHPFERFTAVEHRRTEGDERGRKRNALQGYATRKRRRADTFELVAELHGNEVFATRERVAGDAHRALFERVRRNRLIDDHAQPVPALAFLRVECDAVVDAQLRADEHARHDRFDVFEPAHVAEQRIGETIIMQRSHAVGNDERIDLPVCARIGRKLFERVVEIVDHRTCRHEVKRAIILGIHRAFIRCICGVAAVDGYRFQPRRIDAAAERKLETRRRRHVQFFEIDRCRLRRGRKQRMQIDKRYPLGNGHRFGFFARITRKHPSAAVVVRKPQDSALFRREKPCVQIDGYAAVLRAGKRTHARNGVAVVVKPAVKAHRLILVCRARRGIGGIIVIVKPHPHRKIERIGERRRSGNALPERRLPFVEVKIDGIIVHVVEDIPDGFFISDRDAFVVARPFEVERFVFHRAVRQVAAGDFHFVPLAVDKHAGATDNDVHGVDLHAARKTQAVGFNFEHRVFVYAGDIVLAVVTAAGGKSACA